MNSFVGDRHQLADIDEFCGRLKAVKDKTGPDFVVVARIEALIAGHSLDEALCRADAYAEAGADAILIHSREAVADEILTFAKEWTNKLPVVIVPTKPALVRGRSARLLCPVFRLVAGKLLQCIRPPKKVPPGLTGRCYLFGPWNWLPSRFL